MSESSKSRRGLYAALPLLLTKFGQHSDTYRAETWKYTIEVT